MGQQSQEVAKRRRKSRLAMDSPDFLHADGGRRAVNTSTSACAGHDGRQWTPEVTTMIQALAKLRFVERFCKPSDGWRVFVDIDASEEGRTGSQRQSAQSRARHEKVLTEAPEAIAELKRLGAHVGKRKVG